MWSDWMQNLSFPLAHVGANTMFYGTARMEVAVFGVHIVQNHGGAKGVTIKSVVAVTDIIDHTSPFAGIIMDNVKAHVDDILNVERFEFWADCGPHFRAYEFLGYCYKEWCELFNIVIRICYFAEKHGKGVVAGVFAHVRGWIRTALATPDTLVKTMDGLVDTFQRAAEQDKLLDPTGPTYHVMRIASDRQPAKYYRVTSPKIAGEKSYSL